VKYRPEVNGEEGDDGRGLKPQACIESCFLCACIAFATLAQPGFAANPETERIGSRLARAACRLDSNVYASLGTTPVGGCVSFPSLAERARSAIAGAVSPAETLDRLNRFFFEDEGFTPTFDVNSPDNVLLGHVLAGKKGHCVGLATVYLALAEELNLPIHAVATPKHLFLRWDDGKTRRNIELFQKGRDVSDEKYVREQRIPKESIEQGVFLANLPRREFLGVVYQNLGVLASQREDFESSRRHYTRAIRLNPKLAVAFYNRGNDALKQQKFKDAIRDYTRALQLYPTDAWALHNRGLAWKGLGKMEKAEQDWALVREIEPGFKVSE
jgi:regulator of sirC expression with transglutaminase-like and TPR domain